MEKVTLALLIIVTLASITELIAIVKAVKKSQLKTVFICNLVCLLICLIGQTAQILFSERFNIPPIYFDYIVYVGTCFLPVSVLLTGVIFAKTKIVFKKRYLALFIIPVLSLITLWTNNYHHLFYKVYSTNIDETVYGIYFNTVHAVYTYILEFIGIGYLIRYFIKNSGMFSKQAMLIVVGCAIPVVVNLLGLFKIIPMNIYLTTIYFSITILLTAIAIFKYQFLGVTPIALQKIVDRMSDSYIVLNDNNDITDFNKTFIDRFNINEEKIRGKNLINILKVNNYDTESVNKLENAINQVKNSDKTISYEQRFEQINRYFAIEITSISSDEIPLGILVMLKDITQHKQDMETIQNNQEVLMERERLASLGQLIGGIAHNLKTPIMSISGATEGLEDLIKEYEESIDDPLVNSQDHHEIAGEMQSWIPKIRTHIEYMSDIITTVKGQAVALANEQDVSFSVGELVKKVNILMKHELKNSYIYLNVLMKTDENLILSGDVNSLVQVVNNMISNAIQAYNGQHNKNIELQVSRIGNDVIISVRDFAGGLPKEVQDRLFKEMVTTKGKNGTGLGLYMSYSNIKAHFGGDITFETEEGKGTTFNIILPIKR